MVPRVPRLLGILFCVSIIAQAVVLNRLTGGRAFTCYPNPALARMQYYESAARSVFHDEEAGGIAQLPPPIENDFQLGWLPSGFNRNGLSVLSLTIPALAVAVVLAWPWRARARGVGQPGHHSSNA